MRRLGSLVLGLGLLLLLLMSSGGRRLRVVGTSHQSGQQTRGVRRRRGRLMNPSGKRCLGDTRLRLMMLRLMCLVVMLLLMLLVRLVVLRR